MLVIKYLDPILLRVVLLIFRETWNGGLIGLAVFLAEACLLRKVPASMEWYHYLTQSPVLSLKALLGPDAHKHMHVRL